MKNLDFSFQNVESNRGTGRTQDLETIWQYLQVRLQCTQNTTLKIF